MKTMIALCMSSVLLTVCPAFARIGETEKQIEARYGKPLKSPAQFPTGKARGYSSGGYIIVVVFIDGVSEAEFIKKDQSAPFSAAEIQVLLDRNSDGCRWLARGKNVRRGAQTWMRDDSRVWAVNLYVENLVQFTTRTYNDRVASIAQSSAEKKLKDF